MIVSYNASAVKSYNATSSLVRFEYKKKFFHFEKNALGLLQRWRSEVVGLVLGFNPTTSEFTTTMPTLK
jgi:hypothetical protein